MDSIIRTRKFIRDARERKQKTLGGGNVSGRGGKRVAAGWILNQEFSIRIKIRRSSPEAGLTAALTEKGGSKRDL